MSKQVVYNTWVEVDQRAAHNNIGVLSRVAAPGASLCFAVKANAYGHGLEQMANVVSQQAPEAWLGVHSVEEVQALRTAEFSGGIYLMGPLPRSHVEEVIRLGARFVVYDSEIIREAARASHKLRTAASVHIKIETGNHRQGISAEHAIELCREARALGSIELEGITTHFANIEDITHPLSQLSEYPQKQLERFTEAIALLSNAGFHFAKIHCANSAATLLFPETHFTMVRPGIALYGLWPSESVQQTFIKKHPDMTLMPVLSWKTRIGQIKPVPKGATIGYGCTHTMQHDGRIAVLPVGYYDGYDRGLSNNGQVLIHGKPAPVCGRICMNMTMVDVTDIPEAHVEDEVILIGESTVSVDEVAARAGTINYEITTRIRESIPRVIVN